MKKERTLYFFLFEWMLIELLIFWSQHLLAISGMI